MRRLVLPKYCVYIEQRVTYHMDLDANDIDSAKVVAYERLGEFEAISKKIEQVRVTELAPRT
jgi:hypothetical protein